MGHFDFTISKLSNFMNNFSCSFVKNWYFSGFESSGLAYLHHSHVRDVQLRHVVLLLFLWTIDNRWLFEIFRLPVWIALVSVVSKSSEILHSDGVELSKAALLSWIQNGELELINIWEGKTVLLHNCVNILFIELNFRCWKLLWAII